MTRHGVGSGEQTRVGALLRIRLRSERLPNKGLQQIAGRPAIEHILDRMFASRYVQRRSDVIVCTTDDPSDDALGPVVEQTGARLFRGSSDDLVNRMAQAVERFPFDLVIQVDGDDVCVDPFYMDLCVEAVLSDGLVDISVCEGLPLGVGSKAIRVSAIERVASRYLPGPNGTGAMLYFTHTELCNVSTVKPVSPSHRHETARITLDYDEDLRFFRALFAELYRDGEIFTIDAIIRCLRQHPELVAINADRSEGYRRRSDALINEERLCYDAGEGRIETISVGR